MRILVTGGCGFIGANFLAMLLDSGTDHFALNLDKLTYAGNLLNVRHLEETHGPERYVFTHGDIADPDLVLDLVKKHRIEAVVNFAAETHVDRSITDASPFVTTNVLGVQVLLDVCRKCGVERMVHVSTDEVYGSLGVEGKFTEQTPLAPNSPYSASKASADLLCRAFHKTHGLDVVVTRCSNNYGPYQFPEKLIPLLYLRAQADQALPIYGDGLNVRDWIHVTDHCRGVYLALTRGEPGKIYNFGGNAELTNLDVVRAVLRHLGKPESLITFIKDRPGHDRRYAMDYSLAARELGFEPTVDFDQGLAQTLDWYGANQDWLESVQSGAYREFMELWYGKHGEGEA